MYRSETVRTNTSASKYYRLANLLAFLLAVALAATPRLFPPCAHEIATASGASVAMRCHWTFQVEFLLAIALLVAAGALWVTDHPEARRVAGFGLVLLALLVLAVPLHWVIGLCGNSAMACHRTAHWTWLWGGFLALDGLAIAASAAVKKDVGVAPDPWEAPAGIHPPAEKGKASCSA